MKPFMAGSWRTGIKYGEHPTPNGTVCVRPRGGNIGSSNDAWLRGPDSSVHEDGWSKIVPALRRIRMRLSMARCRTALVLLFFAVLIACSGDKPKELLETAEFEERQMNVPHAKQLYEELIRRYPASQEADKARARLAVLNQN